MLINTQIRLLQIQYFHTLKPRSLCPDIQTPQNLLIFLPEMSDAGDVIVRMLEVYYPQFHLVPAVALKGMHYFPYFAELKKKKKRLERLNK